MRALLALASGALYFLGFVGFGFYPLSWLCFVPVLVAIRDVSPRRALLLGTLFGACTNAGGYYWVIHLLQVFANLALPLAVLGYALLCLYQGFLLALVVWFVRRMKVDFGVAPIWSLPIGFVALELAYPLLFPSFIGNSQYRFSAITQIVELGGMPVLTALISVVNGAAYELVEAYLAKRPVARGRIGFAAASFAAALLYGAIRIPEVDAEAEAARKMKVAIVQTNLGARDKAEKSDEFIRRHRDMTVEAIAANPGIELVVWPESAYNKWIPRSEKNLSARVTQGVTRPLVFGALTYGRVSAVEREMYNTAVLTSSTGDVLGLYDKIELLAFGETLPLLDTFPWIGRVFRFSAFTRGTRLSHFEVGDVSLLPNICYEDIIPSLVRRMWREGGPADVLVNITNDSWYGDTHEPLIHLALATFRSIETRRAMIRSTNTGISAIVDPVGRIARRTGQWTQETLIGDVPVIESGESTLYMELGDVFGWSLFFLFAGGVIASRRSRRRRR